MKTPTNLMSNIRLKWLISVGAVLYFSLCLLLTTIGIFLFRHEFLWSDTYLLICEVIMQSMVSVFMCYVFTVITKTNIPLVKTLILNNITLLVITIFFYQTGFFVAILTSPIFTILNGFIFQNVKNSSNSNKSNPTFTISMAILYSTLVVAAYNILLLSIMYAFEFGLFMKVY